MRENIRKIAVPTLALLLIASIGAVRLSAKTLADGRETLTAGVVRNPVATDIDLNGNTISNGFFVGDAAGLTNFPASVTPLDAGGGRLQTNSINANRKSYKFASAVTILTTNNETFWRVEKDAAGVGQSLEVSGLVGGKFSKTWRDTNYVIRMNYSPDTPTGYQFLFDGRTHIRSNLTVRAAQTNYADIDMQANSITNIATNSLGFADGVLITSAKVQDWDAIATNAVEDGDSPTFDTVTATNLTLRERDTAGATPETNAILVNTASGNNLWGWTLRDTSGGWDQPYWWFNDADGNETIVIDPSNGTVYADIGFPTNVNGAGHKATNFADPVASQDLVTLDYYRSNITYGTWATQEMALLTTTNTATWVTGLLDVTNATLFSGKGIVRFGYDYFFTVGGAGQTRVRLQRDGNLFAQDRAVALSTGSSNGLPFSHLHTAIFTAGVDVVWTVDGYVQNGAGGQDMSLTNVFISVVPVSD